VQVPTKFTETYALLRNGRVARLGTTSQQAQENHDALFTSDGATIRAWKEVVVQAITVGAGTAAFVSYVDDSDRPMC
jgi:hypothetical protein